MDFAEQIEFLKKLINCSSVTYKDDGRAVDLLIETLEPLGFKCHKLIFSDSKNKAVNLYAEYGEGPNNFCFAGHTDVVDPGDVSAWDSNPFSALVKDDKIYGRGIVDMKGAIACFVAAAINYIKSNKNCKISLLIGGDEEETSTCGTIKLLEWLRENNKTISHCLVGEPTNPSIIGESIKVGRRGSINFFLSVKGTQGHAAYPQLADNAAAKMVKVLYELDSLTLDNGTDLFSPSNLEITNITVDNNVTNIIPGLASANFNIRFNEKHSGDSLIELITKTINSVTSDYELISKKSAEVFYTDNEFLKDLVKKSITDVVDITPVFNTLGGTSDARFIHKICPVVEFGLINKTAHKANENCDLNDLETLTKIYLRVLENYFV